jgi:hypothetical protein
MYNHFSFIQEYNIRFFVNISELVRDFNKYLKTPHYSDTDIYESYEAFEIEVFTMSPSDDYRSGLLFYLVLWLLESSCLTSLRGSLEMLAYKA